MTRDRNIGRLRWSGISSEVELWTLRLVDKSVDYDHGLNRFVEAVYQRRLKQTSLDVAPTILARLFLL